MNWPLVFHSLLVSGGATLVGVVGGFLAALWFCGASGRARALFLAASVAALSLPPFLVTNCWIDLLGERGRWRGWFPLKIYSLQGSIWVLAMLTWPVTFLFVTAAWRRLQTTQLEIDPCLEGSHLIRWLLWPMSLGAIGQGAILTFVLALNNFAVPAILQVKVFPAEVWVRFNTTFDYAAALKLSWPLVVAPLLLVWFFRGGNTAWSWNANPPSPGLFRQQLGRRWTALGAAAGVFLVGFSLGAPMWQLGASARTWHDFWPAIAAGPWAAPHSIFYAAVTATVVAFASFLTWRLPIGTALWIPFFAPGVLLGIALIWIFNRPWLSGIYESAGIVIIAYSVRYAALGWNGVSRAIRSIDRSLVEVAQLEGASAWQMLRHVRWPQISGRVAMGWYITYLLCLWDCETIVLIVPPGGESLSLRVFNLLHYGHNSQVNALCLWLVIFAIAPLALWWMAAWAWNWRPGASGLALMAAAAASAVLLTGCSADLRRSAPVQSRFFRSVQIVATRGTGLGQVNKPRSLAVDARDNLYVVDMTGRVQKFSPDGVYLSFWQMPQIEKGKPKGMNRDASGNIIVVEPHYSRVNIYSPEGKLLSQWGSSGTNLGQFDMPRGADCDAHSNIYVCEYGFNDRVQLFTPHGDKCLGSFGRPGDGPGEFNRAENVCVDRQGNVRVADSCNHRIQIFSPDGKFLRAYGKAGGGVGELSYPYDIRIDKEGNQFVCEFGNSRIQVFGPDDKPIEIIGGPGGSPGQFSNPWSIAFDSKGDLYVADAMNNRVQKFIHK